MMKKLTGRAPHKRQRDRADGDLGLPAEDDDRAWAGSIRRSGKASSVDERLKNLIELKGSQMIGCEYCVDLGSQICRNSGLSDEELLALPNYGTSDLFTDSEKVALDYTSRRDAHAGGGH